MCKKKNRHSIGPENSESEMEVNTSDSDDQSTGSSDSEEILSEISNAEMEEREAEGNEEEEEEEDETLKAIRKELNKERDHPPNIQCEDFITDISFHPENDLLAVANIVGDVIIYKYSNNENKIISNLELHTRSCRDVEFSADGKILFSTSKDKSIMLTDVESEKLIRFYENSHECPVYCLTVIDENIFSTGDDDGTVKLWDLREKKDSQIWKTKKNEDFISDMLTDDSKKYLLCSSGDGSLTTIDLQQRKVHMQSEEYDDELTCLGVFRSGTKLAAGSSKGRLYLYNWEEFGLHSDSFPGPKVAVNDMIPITENIVVTACEDGVLRATHLFPHRHLGVVGQHELSIENVDICNTGEFIASSCHTNEIRFWNIQYFENFDKVNQRHKKHNNKKDMKNNLPSSKMKNASDFFSGMC